MVAPALTPDDFGGPDPVPTPQSAPRGGKLYLMPPEDVLRLVYQSTATRWDAFSSRPGYGVTPERVWSVFRQAEMGMPRLQCDLFEDIAENDGHLTGLINNRVETLSGNDFVVRPGGTDERARLGAARLQAALEQINVHEFIEHQLMVFWYGYAASEPVWSLVDGWWVPVWFWNMQPQRFVFTIQAEPRLTTETNLWPGEILTPSWMFSCARHRIPARAGAGRCATWWSVFKKMSVRDWIVFAEKFGIPIPMGIWNERAGETSRQVVEQAIIDIGEAGQAVMSDLCKIVFADLPMRSGDASSMHPAVVNMCNAEMSKLITGATLTVEAGGPGSFAQAKTHENRGINLERADARRLARTFRRTIGRMFNLLNGIPTTELPPYLWLKVMPDPAALLTRAQSASILANELGMELEEDDLRYEHDFRAPISPASAVTGTKNQPPNGQTPPPAGP